MEWNEMSYIFSDNPILDGGGVGYTDKITENECVNEWIKKINVPLFRNSEWVTHVIALRKK